MKIMNALRNSFLIGVHSVQPQNLICKWLTRQGETLKIGERIYTLKDTYIVGFGKAVGGMVPYIENILQTSDGSYIKEGIISVPHGYLEYAVSNNIIISHPHIKLHEGARSNLPDLAAQRTAEKIIQLVDRLNDDSLLFVLISGGGSALLPLPLGPLSLEEKTQIIKSLSLAGASIAELNTVRKAISRSKGGKLVKNTRAEVVSFILSDTISNTLGVIASGPTVPNEDPLDAPSQILQKYNVPMTDNVNCVLQSRSGKECSHGLDNIYNVLIGDNSTALNCIYDHIKDLKELNCIPIILSSSLQGVASTVGKEIAKLAFAILDFLSNKRTDVKLEFFSEKLYVPQSKISEMLSLIHRIKEDSVQSLSLLFGGETTVEVKGKGKGGRNQEMVLSASLEMEQLSKTHNINGEIIFLSGGTDGIDGPTDAAGAMTTYNNNNGYIRLQTCEAREQGLSPEMFLEDNNSYEYFTKLSNGLYLLKPGHTGTNVMDIQLLYIKKFQ